MKKIILMFIPLMVLASCSQKQAGVPAINLADMDPSVKPGDNFFMYANGGWIKNNRSMPATALSTCCVSAMSRTSTRFSPR